MQIYIDIYRMLVWKYLKISQISSLRNSLFSNFTIQIRTNLWGRRRVMIPTFLPEFSRVLCVEILKNFWSFAWHQGGSSKSHSFLFTKQKLNFFLKQFLFLIKNNTFNPVQEPWKCFTH